MAFLDQSGEKRIELHLMDNIKPTTFHSMVQPVMLPSDPDMPPPAPVRTQMGQSILRIPEGFDTLYIMVIGKAAPGDPEEFMGLDPKDMYRLDVRDSGEARKPSHELVAVTPLSNFISEYHELANLTEASPNAAHLDRLAQIEQEIGKMIRDELERNPSTSISEELQTILRGYSDTGRLTPLIRLIQSQLTFHQVQK